METGATLATRSRLAPGSTAEADGAAREGEEANTARSSARTGADGGAARAERWERSAPDTQTSCRS